MRIKTTVQFLKGRLMNTRLGEFEQLLLFALVRLGDETHGVALRREIEARTNRTVSAGAVYTAMERLEARGFVSSAIGEPTPHRGGKRKKHYRLEKAGARALSHSYESLREMAKGVLPKLAQAASDEAGTR
jgi:DNA-binding PadR family transcriptional regulator